MSKEKLIDILIRYGAILVLVSAVGNIYVVLKHIELSLTEARSAGQLQQADAQRRAFEGVLRDFAARANSDTVVQQIFARNQPKAEQPAKK